MPAPQPLVGSMLSLTAPALLAGMIDGNIAFRQHSGGHTTGPNWPTFLTFAARYLHRPT